MYCASVGENKKYFDNQDTRYNCENYRVEFFNVKLAGMLSNC